MIYAYLVLSKSVSQLLSLKLNLIAIFRNEKNTRRLKQHLKSTDLKSKLFWFWKQAVFSHEENY